MARKKPEMLAWFLVVIVFALIVVLLAHPFFRKQESYGLVFTSVPERSRRNLRDEKGSLILALKELDFDFETGKLRTG